MILLLRRSGVICRGEDAPGTPTGLTAGVGPSSISGSHLSFSRKNMSSSSCSTASSLYQDISPTERSRGNLIPTSLRKSFKFLITISCIEFLKGSKFKTYTRVLPSYKYSRNLLFIYQYCLELGFGF